MFEQAHYSTLNSDVWPDIQIILNIQGSIPSSRPSSIYYLLFTIIVNTKVTLRTQHVVQVHRLIELQGDFFLSGHPMFRPLEIVWTPLVSG